MAVMDDELRELRGGNEVTLILPPRKIAVVRVIGLFVIVASLIPLFIGWQFIIEPFQSFLEESEPSRYFHLIFAIAGLIPAIIGIVMLLGGLCAVFLRSYARITISELELRTREQLGPFFKRWGMERDQLKSVQVINAATIRDNNKQVMTSVFYGIIARGSGGKEMRMAPGYPVDLLERVNHIIADECGAEILESQITLAGSNTEEELQTQEDAGPMPEQPGGSNIEFEDRRDGLAIRVPPKGLNKGSKGLFTFAVMWNGLTLVIMAGLMWVAMGKGESDAWNGVFAMFFFLAIGIGIGLGAINMGRRKADILLMHGLLTIKRSNIFGEKVLEIDLHSIKKIIDGPSGMEVNNKKVYELQVFNNDHDKVVGMLSQLDNKELKWLAELLTWKLKQLK